MKKFIFSLLISLFLLGCSTTEIKKEATLTSVREYSEEKENIGPKRKIAISSFKEESALAKRRKVGGSLADILSSELTQSGRFIVLERDSVDKIMQEAELSSFLGEGKTADEQQLLDADYIITGAITKYTSNVTGNKNLTSTSKKQTSNVNFDMRVIDVKTGEVVMADVGEGSASKKTKTNFGVGTNSGYDEALEKDALRAAIIDVLDKFVNEMDKRPWQARVAKISPNIIYINSGNKSNLELGTKLNVYEQGEAIELDGKLLGYEEIFKGVAVVETYLGDDAAKCSYIGEALELPALVKLK